MEEQGKQRLVGAILLVLLAVILAPLVLRSPEQVRVALDMTLPAEPDVARVEIKPVATPEQVRELEQRIEEERLALDRQTEAHADAVEQARKAEAPIPEQPLMSGWAVQVASFSGRDNALALARRLQDANYNAFLREARQGEQTLYRVMAGPELQRARADELRRRLAADERFALDGIVVALTID